MTEYKITLTFSFFSKEDNDSFVHGIFEAISSYIEAHWEDIECETIDVKRV